MLVDISGILPCVSNTPIIITHNMAYSPAPSPPAAGLSSSSHGPNGFSRHSTSPADDTAVAPMSKRDRRRTALQERLQDLTTSFGQNRDALFRQQLHMLQCDMTLINNADPYGPGPLPDSPAEVAHLIESTVGGAGKFARDMASLGGMWYSRFVQEINQIKESRDSELAFLMVNIPPPPGIPYSSSSSSSSFPPPPLLPPAPPKY